MSRKPPLLGGKHDILRCGKSPTQTPPTPKNPQIPTFTHSKNTVIISYRTSYLLIYLSFLLTVGIDLLNKL